MENNNVLNDRKLHNCGINQKDCKFCVYNCENGCPSDQSLCWCCVDKLYFKPVRSSQEANIGLESKKFETFSSGFCSPIRYAKFKPLLSILVDLSIAMCFCSDRATLDPLCKAYKDLSDYIKNAD